MSELRQDPTTYDWVIIARERARRPHEFKKERPDRPEPVWSGTCPFCPGNERMTPEVLARYPEEGDWVLKIVPNKYPALTPDGSTAREERKLFRKTHGYGRHEVLIETPVHNEYIPFMSAPHVESLIRAYRDRYNELKKDPLIKEIIIFKNHGAGAGTSLQHPHSQIVASPIVPPYIRRKYEVTIQYFDNTGRCLHLDLLADELDEKTRVVSESVHFVSLHPFASHYPFETWIMPRVLKSSFGNISEEEIKDLAAVLKDVLARIYHGLGNPDYNLIIDTTPVEDEEQSYYLWHIQIIPRLIQPAGFELGSGIYINVALPEETAAFMRELKVEELA